MSRHTIIDGGVAALHDRGRRQRRRRVESLLMGERIVLIDVGGALAAKSRWRDLRDVLVRIAAEPDARSAVDSSPGMRTMRTDRGLAGGAGRRTLHLTRLPTNTSLLRPNLAIVGSYPDPARFDIVETREIDVERLDDLTERLNVAADFLKLDTQGSEFEILSGGMMTLESTVGVEAEVSFVEIYEGQPLFGDVCGLLSQRGLHFVDFTAEFRWSKSRGALGEHLMFADALFLRDPSSETLSTRQLRVLACVALAYGLDDLVRRSLESLIKSDPTATDTATAVLRWIRRRGSRKRRMASILQVLNRILNEDSRLEPTTPRIEIRW